MTSNENILDSSSFWKDNEPNGESKDEDCVVVRSDGKWNDLRCNVTNSVVCETPCK